VDAGSVLVATTTDVAAVSDPEVPVMLTVAGPGDAVWLAVSVRTLDPVPVGFGEKVPVTPLGKPVAARLTLPENPFCGITLIVASPVPPRAMSISPGALMIVKFGTLI